MTRDLKCFDPNSIELCTFCGLYFDFALSPVFKYKALVGVLSSPISVIYQGRIFLAATEKKKTGLFCFERAHYMFSFMAYANLAMSPKRLETELTNIRRPHFCSLPVFSIEHSFIYFIYLLLWRFFPWFNCLFWHTLTGCENRRTRQLTRKLRKIVHAKTTLAWISSDYFESLLLPQ